MSTASEQTSSAAAMAPVAGGKRPRKAGASMMGTGKVRHQAALYGRKLGMTRIFTEQGESLPVTVIQLGPNVVHQVKTKERNGYAAVQVGFGAQKTQRVDRALMGHLSAAKKGAPKFLGEIRLGEKGLGGRTEFSVGDEIPLEGMFQPGQRVDVMGVTIGRGFAGVIKRHGMGGFPAGRGTHEYFRHGGSIGCRKFPGRVFKNKRMAGHMGCDRVTQLGLEVVAIRGDENLLLVRGSVPGAKNGIVFVRNGIKSKQKVGAKK